MKGNPEKNLGELKEIKPLPGIQVVSVNQRSGLDKIKKQYPKMPIIIGEPLITDEPVAMSLSEMDHDRNVLVDAATETVMGHRIDRLEKRRAFPWSFVTFVFGVMTGTSLTYLAFNLFVLAPK